MKKIDMKVIDEWLWTCGICGKDQGWKTTSEVDRLACCGYRQGVMRRVLEPPKVTRPNRPGGKAPPPNAPLPRQDLWKSVQGADGELYTVHYVACGPGRCICREGHEPIDATECSFCGKQFIPDVRPAFAVSSGGTVRESLKYRGIGIVEHMPLPRPLEDLVRTLEREYDTRYALDGDKYTRLEFEAYYEEAGCGVFSNSLHFRDFGELSATYEMVCLKFDAVNTTVQKITSDYRLRANEMGILFPKLFLAIAIETLETTLKGSKLNGEIHDSIWDHPILVGVGHRNEQYSNKVTSFVSVADFRVELYSSLDPDMKLSVSDLSWYAIEFLWYVHTGKLPRGELQTNPIVQYLSVDLSRSLKEQ
jgi:hypothetical protein